MSDNKRIRRSFRAAEGDWRRVDLHLHTPASADWQEPGITYLQWLQKAESRGLDIVAITDHNTVEGVARLRAEVERLAWLEANDRLRPQERRDLDEFRRLGDKILVLPGFEFTATFGFHILAIFPPDTSLRTLELLLLRLNVPINRLAEGSTEVGASTDVLTAYRLIREAGGLVIAAHANSTHGVAMRGLSFGGQTKIAFTQDPNLHALEVTDLEDGSRRSTARFFDGSKPEYPRRLHCIQGSDAHRLARDPKDKNRLGIGDRVTEFLLPEVSFEALLAVLEGDDFTLTRPYRPLAETPFDHVDAARERGNNIVQSFHESMAREGGRLNKVLCDVVAFANTSGGTIYVGVSAARKGPPRGVERPEESAALLKKEVERNITPPLDVRVDVVVSQGVPIVRATVPSGLDKPYAMNQTRIYVRQEGDTNEAVRDELVQLVLAGRQLQEAEPLQAAAIQTAEEAAPPAEAPTPVAALPAEPLPGPETLPLPGIGVEILSSEERKGARYFTIRDLRNGNTVQNVTLASARKLWSYAINQYLTNPVDPEAVIWNGPYGLWQAARRAQKMRYDLVLRQQGAPLRVFYGVTADGMNGPWAGFLKAEDKGEPEVQAAKPAVLVAAEAQPAMPAEAKPKPRSRRRRGRGGKPSAVQPPEGGVQAGPAPVSPAEPEPEALEMEPKAAELEREAPETGLAAEPSQPPAAEKPVRKPRRRPARQAEEPPGPDAAPAAELPAAGEAVVEVAATATAEVPPAPAPRRRSRSKKPTGQPEAEFDAAVQALLEQKAAVTAPAGPSSPAEPEAAKPKPRARRPKAATQAADADQPG